jgi:HD-GYP domain-containing protein (c-di-GMP phosphodiesterase class II)
MKHARQNMLEGVQDILQTLTKTGGIAIEQVHHVTQSIMADTLGHEEACIAMIRTRDFSPALYDHALTVSTLAVLLGRAVGLTETPLQRLAVAGLLHDAGLLKIPQSLHRPLNQLSDSELGIYHTHPRRGVEMLTKQSPLGDEVETLIREHHTAPDGSGYPSNLDPAELRTSSRILRIVDEYDELLSGHQTGKSLSIRVALQTLYQQGRKGLIDGELVATFINLIGIYPTYGLVELSTGERGIVTANSRDNLLQPTILLIQDAEHRPLLEPIPFNFSVLSPDGLHPEIVKVLAPEQVGIALDSALEDWMTL